MSEIKFFTPITVRYGDLDPQGHVNNAKYLTYFEQARVQYLRALGLFTDDQSFMEIGVILADIHITYHAPIHWGTPIKAGVRTARLGNKSLTVAQSVVHEETGEAFASGEVVMVAFDYHKKETISIPDEWRQVIAAYEGLEQ